MCVVFMFIHIFICLVPVVRLLFITSYQNIIICPSSRFVLFYRKYLFKKIHFLWGSVNACRGGRSVLEPLKTKAFLQENWGKIDKTIIFFQNAHIRNRHSYILFVVARARARVCVCVYMHSQIGPQNKTIPRSTLIYMCNKSPFRYAASAFSVFFLPSSHIFPDCIP